MKIKELRDHHNESQTDLGKKIGKSKGQILRLENEDSHNKIVDMLIKIANHYNVSLDFLCDRQWNNQVGYIPEDRKELIKVITLLTPKNLERVKAYTYAKFEEQDNYNELIGANNE